MKDKSNPKSPGLVVMFAASRAIIVLLLSVTVHAEGLQLIETKAIDGFYIGVASSAFTTNDTPVDDKLIFGVWKTTTNNYAMVYIPTEPEYAYQVELLDTNGTAMPKTRLGEQVGRRFFALDTTFSSEGAQLRRAYATDKPGFPSQYLFFPSKPGHGGRPVYSPNDLFDIKKPGRFTLRIQFQIIVRTGTGKNKTAHIVRFPPLDYPLVKLDTGKAASAAQASPLHLRAGDIQWSEAREGVKVGIRWNTEQFPGNGAIIVYVAQATTYSNNLVDPEADQRFEYALRDADGKPVELTKEGKKYGAALQTSMSRSRRISRQIRLWVNEPYQLAVFRMDDCFELTKAGEYEFEIRLRLLKESGKELLPVIFDPIKRRLRLAPAAKSKEL